MTEPQEFDSIDELFRQTFKDLPESPAPNGWDAPSERVWEHVRTHLPAPKQGWTWRAWSLAGALVVVLALGLYWMSTLLPTPEVEPPSSAPIETPVPDMPAAVSAEVAARSEEPAPARTPGAPAVATPQTVPAGAVRPKPVPPNHATPATGVDSMAEEQSVDKRTYPNNAERRRAEALRQRWNTAVAPLPTVLEMGNRW